MPVTARNHLEGGGDDALAVTAGIGTPGRRIEQHAHPVAAIPHSSSTVPNTPGR
jgi:hypothetical protein